MLQERAMLVALTIHQWTAQRHDKSVTAKVESDNNAKQAGRFNKQLVPRDALEPVRKLATTAREFHYRTTLPWGDNGERLLPSKAYMDYTAKIRELTADYERAVDEFIQHYPHLVASAQSQLGMLYDYDDYPVASALRDKFGINLQFLPVPSARDFRVDVGKANVKALKAQITETVTARQQAAVKDCWERLRDVVSKIEERLSVEDAVFRDSLIENAQMLVELLPKLNFTEDAELEALRVEVQDKLLCPPQRLRDDIVLRKETADAAKEILGRISFGAAS